MGRGLLWVFVWLAHSRGSQASHQFLANLFFDWLLFISQFCSTFVLRCLLLDANLHTTFLQTERLLILLRLLQLEFGLVHDVLFYYFDSNFAFKQLMQSIRDSLF